MADPVINPPVEGKPWWCTNSLTKWVCPAKGSQGPIGPEGLMNQTANMTAGPTGPQGPAGSAGAPGGDSGVIYYFNNTASDVAGYETIKNIPSSAAEVDEAVTINATFSPVLIDSYASPSNLPNTTIIPAGLWEFHTYNYMTPGVTGTVLENITVFNRTAAGVETRLFSVYVQITSTTPTAYVIDYVQENSFNISSTDRLVFKIYGETDTVPDRTFHFVYQGSTHMSHIHTPLSPNIDLTNYAYLPGRPGGQVLNGSTTTGGLTLNGNSNGNGKIGINTTTPDELLTVNGGYAPGIAVTGYAVDSSGGGGVFHSRAARGTAASPLPVLAGDFIGGFGAKGYDGTQFPTSSPSAIHMVSLDDASPAKTGMDFRILTTEKGLTERRYNVIIRNTTIGFNPALSPTTSNIPVWTNSTSAILFGNNGGLSSTLASSSSSLVALTQNAYLVDTWRYVSTLPATRYNQINGVHSFDIAASGTSGDAITWLERLRITSTGVGINTTTPTKTLDIGDGTTLTSARVRGGKPTDNAPVLSISRTGISEWTSSIGANGAWILSNNPSSTYTDASLSSTAKLKIADTTGVITASGYGSGICNFSSTGVISSQPFLPGTKVYYVSDTSGGATTRKLTFTNGILTGEI